MSVVAVEEAKERWLVAERLVVEKKKEEKRRGGQRGKNIIIPSQPASWKNYYPFADSSKKSSSHFDDPFFVFVF